MISVVNVKMESSSQEYTISFMLFITIFLTAYVEIFVFFAISTYVTTNPNLLFENLADSRLNDGRGALESGRTRGFTLCVLNVDSTRPICLTIYTEGLDPNNSHHPHYHLHTYLSSMVHNIPVLHKGTILHNQYNPLYSYLFHTVQTYSSIPPR